MVEWSRTAANVQRAVARAHPNGAPTEVGALAGHLWQLASQASTLAGVLDRRSKDFEQLLGSSGELRAKIEQRIEELAGEESAESRRQVEALRADLARYGEALEADLRSGRQRIEAQVREALAWEVDFRQTCKALVEHLRDEPECRDLLEGIAPGPTDDGKST
jgi:hypothetical protein